ncbi:MAG: protein kinase [Myxococcota bacterium]|nr:protein kinase [Myxococcota bacterium]
MEPKAGQRIREYIIERALGEGGMATVYLAKHALLHNQVAIKVLKSNRKDLQQRMQKEGQVLFSLGHPNIIDLKDMFEEEGCLFLVMEYINGGALDEYLYQQPLPLEDALALFTQIVNGVAFAHEQNIIHRDLKPANIMLEKKQGTYIAKVADFGLVKMMNDKQNITQTGVAMGTPAYMSPEQIRQSKDATPASDVFSLGCILYEMLTGEQPFQGEDTFEILQAVVNQDPPQLTHARERWGEHLGSLLEGMLHKSPQKRIPNGQALLHSLRDKNAWDLTDISTTIAKNETVLSDPHTSAPPPSKTQVSIPTKTIANNDTQTQQSPQNAPKNMLPWLLGTSLVALLILIAIFFTPTEPPDSSAKQAVIPQSETASAHGDLVEMFQAKKDPFLVGLVPLEAVDIEENVAALLTDHLAHTLKGIPNVSLVQISSPIPSNETAILNWAGEQLDAFDVQFIVVGSVGRLGSKYIVSLRRITTSANPDTKARFDSSAYQLEEDMDALLDASPAIWQKIAQEEPQGISKEGIDNIIRQNSSDYMNCYANAPTLGDGRLTLKFVIRGSGRISKASLVSSDFKDEDFHNCLLEKSKRMLFPSSASEITIVQYPIMFGR